MENELQCVADEQYYTSAYQDFNQLYHTTCAGVAEFSPQAITFIRETEPEIERKYSAILKNEELILHGDGYRIISHYRNYFGDFVLRTHRLHTDYKLLLDECEALRSKVSCGQPGLVTAAPVEEVEEYDRLFQELNSLRSRMKRFTESRNMAVQHLKKLKDSLKRIRGGSYSTA